MKAAQKTILVIDDDKDLVKSIRAVLEARNYVVIEAFNGTEARAKLASERPDLIVLDIMMDYDAEGFNLAYELRTAEPTRRADRPGGAGDPLGAGRSRVDKGDPPAPERRSQAHRLRRGLRYHLRPSTRDRSRDEHRRRAARSPVLVGERRGRLFGGTGGVMEAAIRTAHKLLAGGEIEGGLELAEARGLEGIRCFSLEAGGTALHFGIVNGLGRVASILDSVEKGTSKLHFVEVMSCPGGCVGGGQPYATDIEAVRRLLPSRSSLTGRAKPKSVTTTRLLWPTSTLSGLKSRCAIPA